MYATFSSISLETFERLVEAASGPAALDCKPREARSRSAEELLTAQAVAETAAGFTGRWTRADLQAQLAQRDDAADLATSDSRLRGILRDLRQRGYIETVAESPGKATVYGDAPQRPRRGVASGR